MVTSSNTMKKSYNGKEESNVVYDQKGHNKSDCNQSMGAVLISNLAPVQQQQSNHHKQVAPKRQFTRMNMTLSPALQHKLKAELITLKDPPQNPNTSSPSYNNARCAYHSNSPGHATNGC